MIHKMTENEITTAVIRYLKEAKRKELHVILDELHPYDIARIYEGLPGKHRNKFLLYLSLEQLTDMIQELDKEEQIDVLYKLGIEKSSKVLDLMDNDDLAELLAELDQDKIEELLSGMKKEESEAVQNLMAYTPETAGRIMTNRFVWIPKYFTVRQAVDKMKDFAEYAGSLNYLYVVDANKRIVGVISYRDLLLADMNDKIEDHMYTRVITVSVDTDQEEVAKIIERYDFIAVPVVEEGDILVGIITVDDVIDIFIQEANEDFEKLSASGKSIDFDTTSFVAAWRRLPWLILLLFIGILSGSIISGFQETLQKVVALAFFMPMIAGMTGNTGTQSLAVVVRGLVSNDIDRKTIINLVFRELGVGILIGLTNGLLIAIIAYFWQGSFILGLVVGSSLLVTLIIGTMAGTVIPLLLYKLNVDPAVASGPLITTINDIFSLLIYFGIATMFISKLM